MASPVNGSGPNADEISSEKSFLDYLTPYSALFFSLHILMFKLCHLCLHLFFSHLFHQTVKFMRAEILSTLLTNIVSLSGTMSIRCKFV